jgi:hypothetical protein
MMPSTREARMPEDLKHYGTEQQQESFDIFSDNEKAAIAAAVILAIFAIELYSRLAGAAI